MTDQQHALAGFMGEQGYFPTVVGGVPVWERALAETDFLRIATDHSLGLPEQARDRDWSVVRYRSDLDAWIEIVGLSLADAIDTGERIPEPTEGLADSFSSLAQCLNVIKTEALVIAADLEG